MSGYFLDDRLSLAESTCRFPANGLGQENVQEGHYVVAIRRIDDRECLFRFSAHDRPDVRSMLKALNRSEGKRAPST